MEQEQQKQTETLNIYLVRHGKKENRKTYSPLTEIGIKQACLTGQVLKDITFDCAYVSDYERTVQTFKCINQQREAKIPCLYTPQLREISYGKYNNKKDLMKKDLMVKKDNAWYWKNGIRVGTRTEPFADGESPDDILQRVTTFLELLIDHHLLKKQGIKGYLPNQITQENIQNVLLVTHMTAISEIQNYFLKRFKNIPTKDGLYKVNNCGIFHIQLKIENGTIKFDFLQNNSLDHLKILEQEQK